MSAFGSSLAATTAKSHDRTKPPIMDTAFKPHSMDSASFSFRCTVPAWPAYADVLLEEMWESLRALESMTSAPVPDVPVQVPGVPSPAPVPEVPSPVPVPGVPPPSCPVPVLPIPPPSQFPVLRRLAVQPRIPVTRPVTVPHVSSPGPGPTEPPSPDPGTPVTSSPEPGPLAPRSCPPARPPERAPWPGDRPAARPPDCFCSLRPSSGSPPPTRVERFGRLEFVP